MGSGCSEQTRETLVQPLKKVATLPPAGALGLMIDSHQRYLQLSPGLCFSKLPWKTQTMLGLGV